MSDETSLQALPLALSQSESVAPREAGSASRADLFMRRLLRIPSTDRAALPRAHRAFRVSLLISAVRCTVMYLVVPVLVPIVSLATVLTVPIDLALCLFAGVNGVLGIRRFWIADHRAKWKYTAFMAVVFAVLVVALVLDAVRLASS